MLARKAGIKAIFGLETNIVEDSIPHHLQRGFHGPQGWISYVVFDMETIGLSTEHHNPDCGLKMETKQYYRAVWYLWPKPIPLFPQSWQASPTIHIRAQNPLAGLARISAFCQDAVLVAHNASFDVGFMNANYERHGCLWLANQLLIPLSLPEILSRIQAPWPSCLTKRFQVSPGTPPTWPTLMPRPLAAFSSSSSTMCGPPWYHDLAELNSRL